MKNGLDRRNFLGTAAGAGALLGLGDLSFLGRLAPVSAQEAKVDPKRVEFSAEIEPLVRLLEEMPREKVLDEVAARIRKGTPYADVVAALLLAGIRNIQPRPSVGFKFHAVLVVHSAHQAALSAPDADRWIPVFWAIDNFKGSQAADVREGDWTMAPVNEAAVPPAGKARQAFIEAMDAWDEPAGDAAAAAVARSLGAGEAFDLFARYGSRDFRSIGHKAIYVAGAFRLLQVIGWHHAEPVLRGLAFALNARERTDPTKGDAPADKPIKRNRELAREIRAGWQEGKADPGAANEMLACLRQGTDEDAARKAVDLVNRGVSPRSVWDGIFAASGELLMRQRGIPALHAVTTSNALRYAYEAASTDETRRLILLQNASFVPLYRRGQAGLDVKLDQLEAEPPKGSGPEAVAEIMADVSRDRLAAARKVLAFLKDRPTPRELLDAARILVFTKGTDSHDYKFSSAVFEDYAHLTPAWRDRFLASSVYWLKGSGDRDSGLVERARSALRG